MQKDKKDIEKEKMPSEVQVSSAHPTENTGSVQHKCTNADSVYSVKELAAGAQAFDAVPEIVEAALRSAGITECTKKKAAEVVKSFANREVK